MKSVELRQKVLLPSQESNKFMTRFFVRGFQKPVMTANCEDLRELTLKATEAFPGFSIRNPWILSDSLRGMAWVFLDPETETSRSAANATLASNDKQASRKVRRGGLK